MRRQHTATRCRAAFGRPPKLAPRACADARDHPAAACHMFFRRRGCGQPQASGGQAAPGATEPSNRAGLGSAWRSAPAHHCRAGPRWASRATRGSTHPPAHVVSASTSRSTRAREHVPSAFGQDGASGGRGTPQCTRQSKGHGSRCGHQHPAGGVSDAGSAGKPAGLGNLATWMCAGPTTPG